MYDKPTLTQLIDAARLHLQASIVPAVRADRKLYFQTLVAINVLHIAQREIEHGDEHASAEWRRLAELDGRHDEPPAPLSALQAALDTRNQALAQAIRAGDYDDQPSALFAHLQTTAIEALQVANPRFLGRLLAEKNDPALDAWHGR
ncbi:MAG: hypothetical protein EA396_01550 [Anaerolineaceae bacterium]|nr:MAG: hypothetical protein EA396_01550 [Anaerolineaceae bacterium]